MSVPSPFSTGIRFKHFEIEAEVGRGGMGVVYCARTRLNRLIALKVLALLISDTAARERFRREAEESTAGGEQARLQRGMPHDAMITYPPPIHHRHAVSAPMTRVTPIC